MEASGGGGDDRVRNLRDEVEGVKNIMTQNVERILAWGENLDHLRNKTEDLEATSEHFKTTSQKVARKFWWKNVKMIVLICVIVFIIVLFIVLFATATTSLRTAPDADPEWKREVKRRVAGAAGRRLLNQRGFDSRLQPAGGRSAG
ncbi:hypothetical protein R6Z07M_016930 [Ovis aries]